MVSGNEGNLSILLSDGSVLITPSGISKGALLSENLIHIKNGKWEVHVDSSSRITSEYKLHKAIYESGLGNSICHAHPVYATSFSATNKGLPACLLPEIILSVGAIPLVPYAAPSTAELGSNIIPYLKEGYEAFLLQNHGVITVSDNLNDAYMKMEMVEHYAKIVHLNILRNDLKFLTSVEIAELNKIRQELWKKKGTVICDVCGYCKISQEGKK